MKVWQFLIVASLVLIVKLAVIIGVIWAAFAIASHYFG